VGTGSGGSSDQTGRDLSRESQRNEFPDADAYKPSIIRESGASGTERVQGKRYSWDDNSRGRVISFHDRVLNGRGGELASGGKNKGFNSYDFRGVRSFLRRSDSKRGR